MTSTNETWITKLSISFIKGRSGDSYFWQHFPDVVADPASNDDFEPIFTGSFVNTEKQCISLATPGDIEPGMSATLQMQYFDSQDPAKVPHYACSDLVFIPRREMKSSTPCSGPLSDEAAFVLHPPPRVESALPSHSSWGSIAALGAVLLFAYISYFHILPRMRQRQRETGKAMEMAPMMS